MKKEQKEQFCPQFCPRTGELLPVRQVCKPLHYGATECKILRLLHTRNADNFTILFL